MWSDLGTLSGKAFMTTIPRIILSNGSRGRHDDDEERKKGASLGCWDEEGTDRGGKWETEENH